MSTPWRSGRSGFTGPMLSEIIRFGLPSGVQNSVIAFANVIVQSQINSFGRLATAAYGTYVKIEGFAFLPITSFNMASTTFVSQNLGAKQYDRAKQGARFSIFAAVLLAEIMGILYYSFAPQLIGMFDQTPGVIEFGVRQARTEALFYGLLAFPTRWRPSAGERGRLLSPWSSCSPSGACCGSPTLPR